MVQIVLTDEQARLAREAPDRLELCDRQGAVLGSVVRPAIPIDDPDFTREEIEEAHRRLDAGEPTYTTAEVLAHLKSLEAQGF